MWFDYHFGRVYLTTDWTFARPLVRALRFVPRRVLARLWMRMFGNFPICVDNTGGEILICAQKAHNSSHWEVRKIMRILLAAFYKPGVLALNQLFDMGFSPRQIRLLTHDLDRNKELLQLAKDKGILYTTDYIKKRLAQEWIEEFAPNVMFSLYYRYIIPGHILKILPMGGINLHPALLPKYRGCFSVPWAIINGEEYTGFTYHYMIEEVDAGPIVLQERVRIKPDDTAYSLYHRIIDVAMSRFKDVLRLVVEERYKGKPQKGIALYYPRQIPYDGYIDPTWDEKFIERFIRAMYFPPFRPAVVKIKGKEYEVESMTNYKKLVQELGL